MESNDVCFVVEMNHFSIFLNCSLVDIAKSKWQIGWAVDMPSIVDCSTDFVCQVLDGTLMCGYLDMMGGTADRFLDYQKMADYRQHLDNYCLASFCLSFDSDQIETYLDFLYNFKFWFTNVLLGILAKCWLQNSQINFETRFWSH